MGDNKKIIITEKPSVAVEFCKALNVRDKHEGYIESDEYLITYCYGHLIEMLYPHEYNEDYKIWKLEDLPFLPEKYRYQVINDAGIKKQFKIIKSLYHRTDVDTLYLAGDPAREGIYIQFLVLQQAGLAKGIEIKVVWIDSQTEEEIKKGIANAKPVKDYYSLAQSGYMRAIEDYASGINLSRAISLKYSAVISSHCGKPHVTIRVGRVMSCVLGMVVEQERKVKSHTDACFYKVVASFLLEDGSAIDGEFRAVEGSSYYESPLLYQDEKGIKENAFEQERDAQALCDVSQPSSENPYLIEQVQTSESKQYAPALFNLAELQNECSKKLHLSPDKTLEIAQSLYEKKMTTYPRTDARVLSTAIAVEIDKNLTGLKAIRKEAVEHIFVSKSYLQISKSKYTDDTKITDHYAIIPTGKNVADISKLRMEERKVYEMIVDRFLAIFYEPCIFHKISVILSNHGEQFFFHEKYIASLGYKEIEGVKEESCDDTKYRFLDNLKEHIKETAPIHSCSVKEGKAAAPKRFTSGSLILAMENAGKYIEEEELRERIKGSGIGTSATRAETIKKLEKCNYIAINSKTQIVTPTNEGYMVYECLSRTLPEILNPKMTANWEMGLDQIVDKKITREDFNEKMNRTIQEQIERIKTTDITADLTAAIKPYATSSGYVGPVETDICCPLCGNHLLKTEKGYGCLGFKKTGCPFYIGEISGIQLKTSQAKELVEKGSIRKVKGFVSKKKTKFDAGLQLVDGFTKDGKKTKLVKFVFEEPEAPRDLEYPCPKCEKLTLRKESYDIICSNCGFQTKNWVARKFLTDQQIKELLQGRTGLVKGLKKKSGGTFDAYIVLNKDTGELSFEFPKRRRR